MRTLTPVLLGLLFAINPANGEIYSWVDEQGITHFVQAPQGLPEAARPVREALDELWVEGVLDETPPVSAAPPGPVEPGRVEGDRLARLLRGAEEDLASGDRARAEAVLTDVLRRDPDQAEAHWLLARLARARSHYDSADVHLRAFLATAGEQDAQRRAEAERGLVELVDERRLADSDRLATDATWVGVEHPDFRIEYDADFASISRDYAATVVAHLEAAHADVGARLGSVPAKPLGVRFYGKAAYARAHAHRFSFRTVGFFDGGIHVVSAAHPAAELRALLFHEYTHAVFRERTGGDRPFWLNEGLAELSERAARSEPEFSRTERSWLRRRIDAGEWLPLRRIAPGFSGLDDDDVRAAYLQATAAATWIEQRTLQVQRARLLELIGRGHTDDEALFAVLGVDTEEIDRAVREWIRSEFAPARREL